MIEWVAVGVIILILVYGVLIRPRTEARRYSKSRLIGRAGEHSDDCGCKEHRVK